MSQFIAKYGFNNTISLEEKKEEVSKRDKREKESSKSSL